MNIQSGSFKRNQGFSLIEVVIVVTILGILAVVAIPNFYVSAAQNRSKLAAGKLAGDLKMFASEARAKSKNIEVNFWTVFEPVNGNRYSAAQLNDPQHPNQVFTVKLSESPYQVSLSAAPSEVIFDIYGLPNTGGTWVFNEGTETERTVTLEQSTGKVTIQ